MERWLTDYVRNLFTRRVGRVGLVIGFMGAWLWSSYPLVVTIAAIVAACVALCLEWRHPKGPSSGDMN